MDKRGLKTSLVVSIVVMCVLCIYLVFYIVSSYGNSTNKTDDSIIENGNSVDLLFIQRVIDSFNNNCIDMKPFYESNTLMSNVDSNIKLTTVINLINNYDSKSIESTYKTVFNENIVLDKVSGTCPKIDYKNGSINKVDCTCNTDSGVVHKFIKSVKTNNEVKLYYKLAFYTTNKYLGKTTKILSKDADGLEILDSRVIKEKTDELDYQKYLDDNSNDFYTYIYTFKLNDSNYYFYSIEKEK